MYKPVYCIRTGNDSYIQQATCKEVSKDIVHTFELWKT